MILDVIESINRTIVNYAPQYITTLVRHHDIDVYERDLIMKNATVYHYQSPPTNDYESDLILMEFRNQWRYPYLDLQMHLATLSPSFSFEVDRAKLNYLDEGIYKF